MSNYQPPSIDVSAFNCPHCDAFAHQKFGTMQGNYAGHTQAIPKTAGVFHVAECANCRNISLWRDAAMIYPNLATAPLPNVDMPSEIASDYLEAREIVRRSPRGAAALLRLAIQKLCVHLGESGENINEDIKSLVAKGLSPGVQQALDTVRVIGNESVHPGELDIRDDQPTALTLFKLVNFIVEKMISDLKVISEMYDGLPSNKLAGIVARDK